MFTMPYRRFYHNPAFRVQAALMYCGICGVTIDEPDRENNINSLIYSEHPRLRQRLICKECWYKQVTHAQKQEQMSPLLATNNPLNAGLTPPSLLNLFYQELEMRTADLWSAEVEFSSWLHMFPAETLRALLPNLHYDRQGFPEVQMASWPNIVNCDPSIMNDNKAVLCHLLGLCTDSFFAIPNPTLRLSPHPHLYAENLHRPLTILLSLVTKGVGYRQHMLNFIRHTLTYQVFVQRSGGFPASLALLPNDFPQNGFLMKVAWPCNACSPSGQRTHMGMFQFGQDLSGWWRFWYTADLLTALVQIPRKAWLSPNAPTRCVKLDTRGYTLDRLFPERLAAGERGDVW